RWILSRLAQVTAAVDEGFERYDFADGVQKLQGFVWSEFCDWYVELAKRPLAAGGEQRARVQQVLGAVLSGILRLLHPVIPFVTEELWHRLGGEGLLATAAWPVADHARIDEDTDASMAAVIDIVSAIRRFRSEHKVAPSRRLTALVVPASPEQGHALAALAAELSALAGLEALELVEAREPQAGEQRLVAAGATIAVPLAGVVDVAAALADLERQLQKLEAEQAKIDTKLGDDKFTSRAPAHVVEEMLRRQTATREASATLRAQRDQLAGG
ncbi:MAG: class I tRNA ligase family protein, partial [Acidimicrobiales bacterium]